MGTAEQASVLAYPQAGDYVDLVAWASVSCPGVSVADLGQKASMEGWRVLRKLVSQYVDGKCSGGRVPTHSQMFAVYAPASDRKDPEACAQFMAHELGVSTGTPFDKLIDA